MVLFEPPHELFVNYTLFATYTLFLSPTRGTYPCNAF